MELLRIRPLEIAARWAECHKPPRFHTVSAVNAQTCLNGYKCFQKKLMNIVIDFCEKFVQAI